MTMPRHRPRAIILFMVCVSGCATESFRRPSTVDPTNPGAAEAPTSRPLELATPDPLLPAGELVAESMKMEHPREAPAS